MRVRVQLFALAQQLVGDDFVEVEVASGATVSDLREALIEVVPLRELVRHSALAVDTQYASNSTIIKPTSEVVLVPPVSGG